MSGKSGWKQKWLRLERAFAKIPLEVYISEDTVQFHFVSYQLCTDECHGYLSIYLKIPIAIAIILTGLFWILSRSLVVFHPTSSSPSQPTISQSQTLRQKEVKHHSPAERKLSHRALDAALWQTHCPFLLCLLLRILYAKIYFAWVYRKKQTKKNRSTNCALFLLCRGGYFNQCCHSAFSSCVTSFFSFPVPYILRGGL